MQIYDGGLNKTATADSPGSDRRIRMRILTSSITVNNGFGFGSNYDITVVASEVCNKINVGISLMPNDIIQAFNGSIAELLVYAPHLAGSEEGLIEAYLDNKWGL